MSLCARCGAQFGCAMADGLEAPCWCLSMPPVVAVPAADAAASCWCPACLKAHIELSASQAAPPPAEA
ncbi:MAG: cysteine-rich CWC family protein [Pseudomonadota bacterium]